MAISQDHIVWVTNSITNKMERAVAVPTHESCRIPLAISALAEAVMLLAAVMRERP